MQHTLEVFHISVGPVMIKDSRKSWTTFSGRTSHLLCRDPDKQHKWIQITVVGLSLSGVSLFCFQIQAGPLSSHRGGRAFSYDEVGSRVMDPFSSNIP